jgi:toxin CptA
MRSAPAIGFECRPSRTLSVCIVVLTVLALVAIALSGLPLAVNAILVAGALVYGATALWRYRRPRVIALTWRADGSVSLRLAQRAGGQSEEVQGTLQDARMLGFIIVLHLRWPGGRAGVWILPDNLDAEPRRRLRVRLGNDGAQGVSVNADTV